MKDVQVETNLYYSDDNWGYRENFQHLRGDTYVYTSFGSVGVDCLKDLFDLSNNKKRKLIQFVKEYSNYYPQYAYYGDIQNVIDDIFDMYSIETIKDFVYDLEKFGIEVTRKFDRYVSRGYSQGDCVEVFIPHSLRECWGLSDEDDLVDSCEKGIDNYLWGSEIYGTINISFEYEVIRDGFGDKVIMNYNEDFEYSEFSNDAYDFDLNIDGIIKTISYWTKNNVSPEILQLIRDDLEELSYEDVEYN